MNQSSRGMERVPSMEPLGQKIEVVRASSKDEMNDILEEGADLVLFSCNVMVEEEGSAWTDNRRNVEMTSIAGKKNLIEKMLASGGLNSDVKITEIDIKGEKMLSVTIQGEKSSNATRKAIVSAFGDNTEYYEDRLSRNADKRDLFPPKDKKAMGASA